MGCEGCGVEVFRSVGDGIGDGKGAQKLAPSATGYSRRVLSIIPGYGLAGGCAPSCLIYVQIIDIKQFNLRLPVRSIHFRCVRGKVFFINELVTG